MALDYLYDVLTEDDLDAINIVVDPKTVRAIRAGTPSDKQKLAIKKVDVAIAAAPTLTTSVTIYKSFSDGSPLLDSIGITEKAFFTGTSKKPDGKNVTIAVAVPVGAKALCLPDGAYILKREMSFSFQTPKVNFIPAVQVDVPPAQALSVRVLGLYPPRASGNAETQTEFYNKHHGRDGRFGSGKSGGGGGGAKAVVPPHKLDQEKRLQDKENRLKKQQRIAKVRTIMNVTRAVVGVSLLVGLVVVGNTGPRTRPGTGPGNKNGVYRDADGHQIEPETTKGYTPEQKGRPSFPDRSDNPKYGMPKPGLPWDNP